MQNLTLIIPSKQETESLPLFLKELEKFNCKKLIVLQEEDYATKNCIDKFDNIEFWELMRKWSKNNLVIISETNAPNDFISIWEKTKTRSICQSKKTRYKNTNKTDLIKEKLFVYKDLIDLCKITMV